MELPVSREVLSSHLDNATSVLAKWRTKLDEPLPGWDLPGSPEAAEELLGHFVRELRIVAGVCDTLASALSEDL